MPGLKLVHTFHFGNYPHARARLLWMERCLLAIREPTVRGRRTCSSSQVRDGVRLRPATIGTIWNGVAASARQPATAGFRSQVGAENRILIGTIATLIEQKGLRDLMRVARKVKDAAPGRRSSIVGGGTAAQGTGGDAAELDLDDTVVLTGWVTDAALGGACRSSTFSFNHRFGRRCRW